MEKMPRVCSPDVFRTVYRLCLRLTRKTPFAPYLCAVHADCADAENQLAHALQNGEVICRMQSELLYVLLFAHTEAQADQTETQILRTLPHARTRVQCVRAEAPAAPDLLA